MDNNPVQDNKITEKYRSEFPVSGNSVYLDHAGVAPVSLRVKSAVESFLAEASERAFMNYERWMERVDEVRALSAELVGADPEEVAFIKNTSHGISIVSSGLDWREGDNVILFEKDFPSNIYPWLDLGRLGVEVKMVPLRDGRIFLEDIEKVIDSRTRLVSMSSVQSLNGSMIDLKGLGELCTAMGALLFVDAIQSLGVVPMDVKEYNIDFLAADGHKWLLAPEGTGIFYCRKDLAKSLRPSLIGWKSVENDTEFEKIDLVLKDNALRFEEGSFNVMGIYALGAALELLNEVGIGRIRDIVHGLGDVIIREAEKRGFDIKTPRDRKERAGIISFSGKFDPALLREKLRSVDIVVNYRGGALRVAPHFYNTEEEILRLFEAIDGIIPSL